jgi:hypothetical protein
MREKGVNVLACQFAGHLLVAGVEMGCAAARLTLWHDNVIAVLLQYSNGRFIDTTQKRFLNTTVEEQNPPACKAFRGIAPFSSRASTRDIGKDRFHGADRLWERTKTPHEPLNPALFVS